MQAVRRRFRGFDFDIDGLGAVAHREVENGQLLFDAAVESAVVLVAPAGGQNDAIGELFQEAANGLGPLAGLAQEVQAEFQKDLARLGFTPSVVQKCWYVRQAQRNADAREGPVLRHRVLRQLRIPQASRSALRGAGFQPAAGL